jgi:hypothetical protein
MVRSGACLDDQVVHAYLWNVGGITPAGWGKRYARCRLPFAKKREGAAVRKSSSRTGSIRRRLLRGTLGGGLQEGAVRTWRPECVVRGRHIILHGLSILRLLVHLVLMILTAQFGGGQIGDFARILVYLLIKPKSQAT